MSDDLAYNIETVILRRLSKDRVAGYTLEMSQELAAIATDEINRLTAENARLREALKFYADPAVYKAHPHGPAFDDRDLSFVARAALPKEPP